MKTNAKMNLKQTGLVRITHTYHMYFIQCRKISWPSCRLAYFFTYLEVPKVYINIIDPYFSAVCSLNALKLPSVYKHSPHKHTRTFKRKNVPYTNWFFLTGA